MIVLFVFFPSLQRIGIADPGSWANFLTFPNWNEYKYKNHQSSRQDVVFILTSANMVVDWGQEGAHNEKTHPATWGNIIFKGPNDEEKIQTSLIFTAECVIYTHICNMVVEWRECEVM